MSAHALLPPLPSLSRPLAFLRPSRRAGSLCHRSAFAPSPPLASLCRTCAASLSWKRPPLLNAEAGASSGSLDIAAASVSNPLSTHPTSPGRFYTPNKDQRNWTKGNRGWTKVNRGWNEQAAGGGSVQVSPTAARVATVRGVTSSNPAARIGLCTQGAGDSRLSSPLINSRRNEKILRRRDRGQFLSIDLSLSIGRCEVGSVRDLWVASHRQVIATATSPTGGQSMAMAEASAVDVLPSAANGEPKTTKLQDNAIGCGGSVRQLLSNLITESLKNAFPDLLNITPIVMPCNNPTFGDYQCNNAMALFAKIKGNPNFKNPRSVGEAIMKNLPDSPLVESTSIAGPGFVNIKLGRPWLEQRLETVLSDGLSSWAPILPVKRVVVDFSSPNIAKEMHVGHLRSTIIGDCICRMFEYCNVEVLRRNHVGDWGTQFGMLIQYLFEKNPNWMSEGDQAIGDLQNFYKAAKVRFDEDAEFKEKAQQAVVKLQGGDEFSRLAWTKICDVSRKEFQEIYDKLEVKIEEKGESFYNPFIPSVLESLGEKGLTEVSEGALCIFVPGFKVPLIVRKTDGGFNYASTDLTALWYRMNTEKADRIIYVTDVGQSNHFSMVFKAAEMAGWLDKEGSEGAKKERKVHLNHVGFGLVLGSDGKRFRTRSTEVVRLADLLDEAKNRSKAELIERESKKGDDYKCTEEELEHAARAVGYGAVKYADLKVNRLTNYTFSFEQMLDTRGNTAVYMLYAHARICSIIRKSGKDIKELCEDGRIKLEHPMERQLALTLVRFSDVLEDAVSDILPNQVCEYLYDLSTKFTDFYNECQVVGSPEQTSRLLLCEVTASVMRKCFRLLGITPLYRL